MRASVGLILLVAAIAVIQSSLAICPAELPAKIDAIVNQDKFKRAGWSIQVESVSTSNVWKKLYTHNPEKYSFPASNNKLLTIAAALSKLGTEFVTKTEVWVKDKRACVKGGGDMTFTTETMTELASKLAPYGVLEEIVFDNTFFNGNEFPANWEWADLPYYYSGHPSAFLLNENVVEFNVGPGQKVGDTVAVKMRNPPFACGSPLSVEATTGPAGSTNTLDLKWNIGSEVIRIVGNVPLNASPVVLDAAVTNSTRLFSRSLNHILEHSFEVEPEALSGGVCDQSWGAKPTFVLVSDPAFAAMVHTMKVSDNVMAEMWQRHMGVKFRAETNLADPQKSGLAVVRKFLIDTVGLAADSFHQDDGSGLSTSNLVTAEALAALLRYFNNNRTFEKTLPIGGVDGTLRSRFINTPAQGLVHAKTGTINGVSSLSGYVYPKSFDKLVFSILVNRSTLSAHERQQAIDEIVVLLAQLQRC